MFLAVLAGHLAVECHQHRTTAVTIVVSVPLFSEVHTNTHRECIEEVRFFEVYVNDCIDRIFDDIIPNSAVISDCSTNSLLVLDICNAKYLTRKVEDLCICFCLRNYTTAFCVVNLTTKSYVCHKIRNFIISCVVS